MKTSFTDYASRIRLPDCSKLAVNWKNSNDVTIFDMTSSSNFFDVVFFLLSSLVTGPSFMSIPSLVQELRQFLFIRNWPEIGNTPIWVLHNIWRLGRIRNTKFCTNISNNILLNAAKCKGCSFYRFWVIKEKPTGRGCKITPLSHPD